MKLFILFFLFVIPKSLKQDLRADHKRFVTRYYKGKRKKKHQSEKMRRILTLLELVRPKGFEPLAFASGGQRSIQLSYGRTCPCIILNLGNFTRITRISFRKSLNTLMPLSLRRYLRIFFLSILPDRTSSIDYFYNTFMAQPIKPFAPQ